MSDIEEIEDTIGEIEIMPLPQPARPSEPQTLFFEGIEVQFPCRPYESQIQMMASMMKGMTSGQHCLLESPTGTGKTLALLCAALAWQKDQIERNPSNDIPKIIYVARTHSQLQQVVNQLKTTAYAGSSMVILASREQTCLNSTARAYCSIGEACEAMRSNCRKENSVEYPQGTGEYPTCGLYSTYKEKGAELDKQFSKRADGTDYPYDIEDLKTYSSKCNTCAYYQNKIRKEHAALILCVYSHILHPHIREALGIELENAVLIFDEAHNVDSQCTDMASRKVLVTKMNSTILPALANARSSEEIPEKKIQPLRRLEVAFTKLCNWLNAFLSRDDNSFEKMGNVHVYPIRNPVETFSAIGFSPEECRDLYLDYRILTDRYNDPKDFDPEAAKFKVDSAAMSAVSSILFTFSVLFWRKFNGEFKSLKHYAIDVVKQRQDKVELQINCMSPSVLFEAMKAAHTIVVTSGTLSPTAPFCSELGVKFDHILSADHIIGRDRVFAASICAHPDNKCPLKFNYKTLYEENRFHDVTVSLGDFLLQRCEQIKKGFLVFFPSKSLIMKMKSVWESDGTLQRLSAFKQVFFEHEIGPTDFTNVIEQYREHANKSGAIMFAVLKGRVSEGVDFADDHARCVVTIGIPFLPIHDLKVKRKKQYNDSMRKTEAVEGQQLLTGNQWYQMNAFRSLNQAFGRCVRHSNDWGVLFLVDERHSQYTNFHSNWVCQSNRYETGTIVNGEMPDDLNAFLNSVAPNYYDYDETQTKRARLDI